MINDIVAEPEIGKIYEGKVVKTLILVRSLIFLEVETDSFILVS